MTYIKQHSDFDYHTVRVDAPEGVHARITRLTPSLPFDATVILPKDAVLPDRLAARAVVTSYGRRVVHASFNRLSDAREWSDKVCDSISG